TFAAWRQPPGPAPAFLHGRLAPPPKLGLFRLLHLRPQPAPFRPGHFGQDAKIGLFINWLSNSRQMPPRRSRTCPALDASSEIAFVPSFWRRAAPSSAPCSGFGSVTKLGSIHQPSLDSTQARARHWEPKLGSFCHSARQPARPQRSSPKIGFVPSF